MGTVSRDRPTLLIVEDNRVAFATLEKSIQLRRGDSIRVLHAKDGKEGLQAARLEKPDLILLDWSMPQYDGRYFLDAQAKDSDLASIPVLLHTAPEDRCPDQVLQEYPAVKNLVRKPLPPAQVYDIIMGQLRSRLPSPNGSAR